MGDFSSVSKFRLNLVGSDGIKDKVVVQIGLDGLKIMDTNSDRTMRSLELGHISRWQSRGDTLIMYTKTPSDVEERQLTFQGDESVIRSTLDTLTCSCMQLAELLQSKQSETAHETATTLNALVAGGGKKKTKLPTADEVEYWKSPEKAGWLQCQGEHLKSWRKRWFVLKQGFLFRFMNASVSETSKPRGVVELSKVQDMKHGSSVTGKPNSIQLKTSSGRSVCYIMDTETELVEWMSALEVAVQRICKHAAGLGDDDTSVAPIQNSSKSSATVDQPSGGSFRTGGGRSTASDWMRQLEKTMESFDVQERGDRGDGGGDRRKRGDYGYGSGSSSTRKSGGDGGPVMVSVVGYESQGGGSGGEKGSRDAGGYGGYGGAPGGGSSSMGCGHIAGARPVDAANDMMLNYGGGDVSMASIASDSYLSRGVVGAAPSSSQAGYSNGRGYKAEALGGVYASDAVSGYGGSYGISGNSCAVQEYGSSSTAAPVTAAAAAAPFYGYGQTPVEYAPGPAMSLIDQAPQQQPAYPNYQMASHHQPLTSSWQVHFTGEGRPYYHDPVTGITQWDAPSGFGAA